MLHPIRIWSLFFPQLSLIGFVFVFSATVQAQTKSAPKAPVVPSQLDPNIATHQSGVRMTLLAEHPSLATPTGIDVDHQGRIWLIACHTHFRPEGYQGPEHDEIWIFDPSGQRQQLFYNKTDATMHIRIGNDGWVYLAERDRILRVKDTDGDGKGDREEDLAVLDTVTDYPHNGLSGMAWHSERGLLFSLGENFGKDWTLTGRDGSKSTGRGEGGIFSIQADGTRLRRIARGFWNPFGLMVRSDGEIFAAENDPGSRPPCRLLQIVQGADYGFQWVYGSSPVHPFVAWNGELRGTLGMIHPCGEGPSAIVPLGGGVLIPSWSNHAIDYFPLHRQGAGYTSKRVEVVSGSEYFRPVAMAVSPTNEFFLTDWVFSSYEVHGRGRLWKLEVDRSSDWVQPLPEPINELARLAQQLREGNGTQSLEELLKYAKGRDPYLSDAALTAIAKSSGTWTIDFLTKLPASDRLWCLVALRRVDLKEEKWVRAVWLDHVPAIRFEALRWIADGVLTSFSADVEKLLQQQDLDFALFEAALATFNTLRGNPGAGVTDPEVLLQRLRDPASPTNIKSFALRLIPSTDKRLDVPLLRELLERKSRPLSVEVVRTLSEKKSEAGLQILAAMATDESLDQELRADAIAGLEQPSDPQLLALLWQLAQSANRTLRHAALRSLRNTPTQASLVQSIAERFPESKSLALATVSLKQSLVDRPQANETSLWLRRLEAIPGTADPSVGRRLFHGSIGRCSQCHRHAGRGNVVGPELTYISQQGDRESLLRSILEPNRDVAPQYFSTALQLADGNIFTGILLRSSSTEVFRDDKGKERVFQKKEIVDRKELKTSMMPSGLIEQMTDEEIRDLLAFLMSPNP